MTLDRHFKREDVLRNPHGELHIVKYYPQSNLFNEQGSQERVARVHQRHKVATIQQVHLA